MKQIKITDRLHGRKLSDVISSLQELLQKHGNHEVCVDTQDFFGANYATVSIIIPEAKSPATG